MRHLGFLSIFYILLITFQSEAATRDRVIVKDANVFTDTYQPLRCSHIFLFEGTLETAKTQEEWLETEAYLSRLVNRYGFNCIRIAVWNWQMGNHTYKGYSPINEKTQFRIQRYVDFAKQSGVYIMLNLHSNYNTPYRKDYKVGEGDNEKTINVIKNAKTFWTLYGKKYKNDTHVIFELANEPKIDVNDFPNMVNLYQHLRKIAPKTHIIVWSFNITSQINLADLLQYSGKGKKKINYKNASVGFHNYENDGLSSWQDAQDWQQAGFPVICTEFQSYQDYTLEDSADLPHYFAGMKSAERLGIGWTGWVYEASLQSNYFDKGEVYPNDFLEQAELFGVKVHGIEIDNTPQKPGKKPAIRLALKNSLFDQKQVALRAYSKNSVKAHYYSGNIYLGTSTSAPDFDFEWKNAPLGDHKISVRGESKKGVFFRSKPEHIVVTNDTGFVLNKQSFEYGLQGWLGKRAGATLSTDHVRSGTTSLYYKQPGVDDTQKKSLSKDRGVVLDITQELSAFGPGQYQIALSAKSIGKNQKLLITTKINQSRRKRTAIPVQPEDWTTFDKKIDILWSSTDLKLGLFSIESPDQVDFVIDDVTIRKVSEITPLEPEENFP